MASVGSTIFVVVAFLIISLLAVLLLRYYLPLRTTPAYLTVPVFLALALPANLILLVPIDLASNPFADEAPRGIWLPQRALLVAWRISYWLTFVLTWLILPILGEYVDSGDREPKEKLMYSLRSNGRYYLGALAVGVLGAVYFTVSQGLSFNALSALVMALAYAWGLILAIYLMGHGLVAIPRNVLRNADIGRRLRRLQCGAPGLYEKLIDATDELKEYEHRIVQLSLRKGRTAKDFREWIEELADMISVPDQGVSALPSVSGRRQNVPEVITAGYLADLTRSFMRSRHKKQRYVTEWQNLLASATRTQLILDAKPSGRLIFPDSTAHWISPALRYRLYAQVFPMASYASGALLSVASAAVVWSELTKTLFPHVSPVSRTVLPTSAKHIGFFPSQIFAAFWILYMTTCALYSITVIPIWGNRALVRRTTYAESAAWYAAQVARLTVPLAYNFLTFLPKDVLEKTRFYRFLGAQVNFTPLGRGFSAFFPALLLIPVAAALFGLYGRIKAAFGFEDLMAEEDDEGMWREGKILIDQEVRNHGATGGVGLGSPLRANGSLDIERGAAARDRPFAATPPPPSRYSSGGRALGAERRPLMHHSALGGVDSDDDAAAEDPGFLSDFARRVRNTFSEAERPGWLRAPQWGGGGGGGGGGRSRDWGTLFGGQGGVRL
jgi:hypothetical protein